MTAYPPDQHMLRDLRFTFEHDGDGRGSRAWMPVVPEICTDLGHARAGALATLVDVIGGGLAASAAAPSWIATADLTLHVVGGAAPGAVVEARGTVLRAGRTTVVIEVALADDTKPVGFATMSFSVLPRRDSNPQVTSLREPGPSTMSAPDSHMRMPFLDALGVTVVDAATGELDVPVSDWSRNSMGAMQGGVVATVVDAAAEVALREASGVPLVVSDVQLTYLGFGRVGPVRTRTEVLACNDAWGAAGVELVDTGAEHRDMTIANAVATRGFSA